MKRKTINTVLTKVHREWCASIQADSVRELAEKNTIITGGCIASMLLDEKVNDYDIYFSNFQTVRAVADYYVNLFNGARLASGKSAKAELIEEDARVSIRVRSEGIAGELPDDEQGEELLGQVQSLTSEDGDTNTKPKYMPVFMSTNAITLSNKIQIVLRFYGDPDQIHTNYDYVHCTNYWTPGTKTVLRPEALESLLSKELRYVGSKYPLCSIFRMRKFIRRGWSINAGQILKMCMQLNALDLNNIEVLEDQLTGVDVAYFIDVIQRLKDKDPAKVDSAYLIEIIDRMF